MTSRATPQANGATLTFLVRSRAKPKVRMLKCFDTAVGGRTRYTAHAGCANARAAPGTPPPRSNVVRAILSFAEGPVTTRSKESPDE
jgi:hypothetical protein